MSKIVYLFGAGASFGKRSEHDKDEIIEGIPIVNEFSTQIQRLINKIRTENKLLNEDIETGSVHKISKEDKDNLVGELIWLKEACEKHHSIDTFAKKLRISAGSNFAEYHRLKFALSTFLVLIQLFYKPDSRYDAFFANIFGKTFRDFPKNLSILSWNYDCQFELAYNLYCKQDNLNRIWDELNVFSKTIKCSSEYPQPFTINKLNGTALTYDTNLHSYNFFDVFFNREGESEIKYVSRLMINALDFENVSNALSFAWEESSQEFTKQYQSITTDTEILVIIGYSFPYFNREIDRSIIRNMANLKKVYIQDPFCQDVKESFEATLSLEQLEKLKNGEIEIVLKKSVKQFLIPNEM